MPKRIIPIASGKGGVGKTTVAVNFALALSRQAPTVLVDLDTGTSSVRASLDVPIRHDLYHFFRRGTKLSDCITRLDSSLDRQNRFGGFGFVAGPRHFIEELANPARDLRQRLAAEINALPAEYVVLDLRAGIDANVLDFLPYTNSGLLVMTPHLPQATLAASEIVKAVLFRTLRLVFAEGSEVFRLPGFADGRELVQELLNRAEDVYDETVPSLDFVLKDLRDVFGEQPLLSVLEWVVDDFRVHYVLNMFNGVEEGHASAIAPFTRNLTENVSSRIEITQLGWVLRDERVHRANCSGRPLLLDEKPKESARLAERPSPLVTDPVMAQLESLRSTFLGIDRRPRRAAASGAARKASSPKPGEDLLAQQLSSLRSMFFDRRKDGVQENFSYLVFRALQLMAPPRLPTEFGMSQIAPPEQLVRWLLKRMPATGVPA